MRYALRSFGFRLRLAWYRADKEAGVFALVVCAILAGLSLLAHGVFEAQEARRAEARAMQVQDLACLARNVYFEARGEPLAGQIAVAEVTMNRVASRRFPNTVCQVVYQKGAFSWTDLHWLAQPAGDEWARAQKVAAEVYFRRLEPALPGVLYYHADDIRPDWARGRRRVAHIGGHIFYR